MWFVYLASRCGSGWTSSRTRTSCSMFAKPAPSTRVCRWSLRHWWTAALSANRNSAKTRPPANFSTPETFPSIGNGLKGNRTTNCLAHERIASNSPFALAVARALSLSQVLSVGDFCSFPAGSWIFLNLSSYFHHFNKMSKLSPIN